MCKKEHCQWFVQICSVTVNYCSSLYFQVVSLQQGPFYYKCIICIKIMEWLGLEGILKNPWFPPLPRTFHQTKLLHQPGLKHSQSWDNHSFSQVVFPLFSSFCLLSQKFWEGNIKISLGSSSSLLSSFYNIFSFLAHAPDVKPEQS